MNIMVIIPKLRMILLHDCFYEYFWTFIGLFFSYLNKLLIIYGRNPGVLAKVSS
jgi:hypothetical protein